MRPIHLLLAVCFINLIGAAKVECQEGASNWSNRVYLASFPRSGSHWLRELIEEATGVATGSVYCDSDPQHLPDPFPWQAYYPEKGYEGNRRLPNHDEIVMVKTHFPALLPGVDFDMVPFTKAVCVIRDPFDAFFSFWIYVGGNPNELFPPYPDIVTARSYSGRLIQFVQYWEQYQNVIFVRYEDLYAHPYKVLKALLTDIGYEVTDDDVKRAVLKYPPRGGLMKYHHYYRPQEIEYFKGRLEKIIEKYGYTVPDTCADSL